MLHIRNSWGYYPWMKSNITACGQLEAIPSSQTGEHSDSCFKLIDFPLDIVPLK